MEELPHLFKKELWNWLYYGGISLLQATYKILSNILFSKLTPYMDEITGDHQCGFQRNRSTSGLIYSHSHITRYTPILILSDILPYLHYQINSHIHIIWYTPTLILSDIFPYFLLLQKWEYNMRLSSYFWMLIRPITQWGEKYCTIFSLNIVYLWN
jgi:hypothetical protein